MRFTKMHGIGNDYVYVDCFAQPMPADPAALAKKIADRHFGVGGDGLILICPSDKADARMRMFNADGSEAEMCGNGVRCVAKYVYDHGIARKPTLKIETGNGVLHVGFGNCRAARCKKFASTWGNRFSSRRKFPRRCPARIVNYAPPESDRMREFKDMGIDPRMTCVSMGNPHLVLYCGDVKKVPLEALGPKIEHRDIFPNRINVHFVQVHSPQEVTMRTWERGSGITLACGTGAAAVCVAGVLTGRTGRKILAHLPGGDLELEWNETDNHVYMTGPATEVFSGEWAE